jgi:hypothetical protein
MASQTIKDTTPAPIRLTNIELGRAMGRACDAWRDERERYAAPSTETQPPRRRRSPIVRIGAFLLGLLAPIIIVGSLTGQVGFGFTIENGHADAYLEGRNPFDGQIHGYRWCSDPESMQAKADVPPE